MPSQLGILLLDVLCYMVSSPVLLCPVHWLCWQCSVTAGYSPIEYGCWQCSADLHRGELMGSAMLVSLMAAGP